MTGCLQTCHSQHPPQPPSKTLRWLRRSRIVLQPLPNLFQTSYNTARPALLIPHANMVTHSCLTLSFGLSCGSEKRRSTHSNPRFIYQTQSFSWSGSCCWQHRQHAKLETGWPVVSKSPNFSRMLIYDQAECSSASGVHCGRKKAAASSSL